MFEKEKHFGVIFWLEESLESQGWFPNGLGLFFLVPGVQCIFWEEPKNGDLVIHYKRQVWLLGCEHWFVTPWWYFN